MLASSEVHGRHAQAPAYGEGELAALGLIRHILVLNDRPLKALSQDISP